MPQVQRLLESSLYVADVARSVEFYTGLFGFETLFRNERAAGLNVRGESVLLLFRKGGTPEPLVSERGTIPPHDGDGRLHLAFSIRADELEPWEARLRDGGIEVEARYDWELGGRSLYFRDPDAHLVELVTPGCWTIY